MIVILMSLVGLVGTKPKEQVKNDQPEVFHPDIRDIPGNNSNKYDCDPYVASGTSGNQA